MFSLILAHTNDYISKDEFVAAGAGLLAFGLGAMVGLFYVQYLWTCWFKWILYFYFSFIQLLVLEFIE